MPLDAAIQKLVSCCCGFCEFAFRGHCPTCPRLADADADAHALAAVAVAAAGERCCKLRPQETVCGEGSSACFPRAFAGRCLHFLGLARYLRVMPRHDFEALASGVPCEADFNPSKFPGSHWQPCLKAAKFQRSSRWQSCFKASKFTRSSRWQQKGK